MCGNQNVQFRLFKARGALGPICNHVLLYVHALSAFLLCVHCYYLCDCQRCAPAVYLSFSKWSPNVGANFSVEFSPPDTRRESSRRSRSRENASAVNQLGWAFYNDSTVFANNYVNRRAYAKVTRPKTLAYSALVWLAAGSCGDPRGERVSDGEVGRANAEAEGGSKGPLDKPNKRLNL